MGGRRGSWRVWTLVILPAMAISACGGSRLTHDAIVAAVNGGTLPTAQAQQQGQQLSTVPQNAAIPSAPGTSSTGGASERAAGTAPSISRGAATGATGVSGGGTSPAGASVGTSPTAAKPAGPLAPIVLGNVGTESGPVASSIGGTDTMVQVWAQWTNAHGGIAGHPVQVYTADDGGDPQRSVSLVKDMVETKHVIAFLSNMVPFTIQPQLSYLHQRNIPIIGGDNTTPTWTEDSLAFPTGTTMGEAVFGNMKVAHQRNLNKIGVVYCIETPACTLIRDRIVAGASRAGVEVVYQAQTSITQPDFTAQCLGAQSAGAQVIFISLEANSIMRLGASCSRQNYHPTYTTVSIATTRALEGNKDLEGLFSTSSEFPYMAGNTPATAQFQQAAREYAPSLPLSGAMAIAWASGQLLAKAAAHVGAQPTSQDILNGLWTIHNETLGGLTPPLNYVKNQPTPPISCYFLIELKGERWTTPSADTYEC